ncbi:MAG: diphthamide synthesis protein [Candidatus Altiarchaeota archaeon]
MTDYDFEIERILAEIKKTKAKRVGLQFPEGLKGRALDIAREVESKTRAKAVIFADPTYGACDLKESQSKKLKLDLLIHFGHMKF